MATTTNTTQNTIRITFLHPRSADTFEADVDRQGTGRAIIQQLRDDGWLPDPGRSAFALALKDQSLDLDKPLAEQGVTSGSSVQVLLPGVGGATVSR